MKIERLYIQGYKIYRANYNQGRKGVAILINTNINMEAYKVLEDPSGRYVKVKLIDRETKDSLRFRTSGINIYSYTSDHKYSLQRI